MEICNIKSISTYRFFNYVNCNFCDDFYEKFKFEIEEELMHFKNKTCNMFQKALDCVLKITFNEI